jgi:hypothetical protein
MQVAANYVSELELGGQARFRNLTMFSLEGPVDGSLDYQTLAEALELGTARVSEISDGGSVPELLFENSGELPVLILDGEELVGAKQNRTVNLTVLAPPRRTIKIPVSCVEAGRWRHQSAHLVMSDRHHFARGRAVRAESVSRSLRLDGSRRSDQGRVWADISAKAARMRAASPTEAMAEIFDRHRQTVDGFVEVFTAGERQTGALFAIGSEVVGLDLFDRPTTLASVLPKLVRSYAIDAVDSSDGNGEPATPGDAEAFLAALAEAEVDCFEAVGLGQDLRLASPGLVGGGLAVDDHLVHLAAFTIERETVGAGADSRGMASMRFRRSAFRRR